MQIRDIDGAYVKRRNVNHTSIRKRVLGRYPGHASLLGFLDGDAKLVVEAGGKDLCLIDKDYQWLNYIPDGENWRLTAFYDATGSTIEWYYDVTRRNFVNEHGAPCADDLYLDIVVLPDGTVETLDEDELSDALAKGVIGQNDFDLAWRVHGEMINSEWMKPEFVAAFCEGLLKLFM